MFLLVASAILTFVFGFVCPPLWIVTFLSVRSIIRTGRENHDVYYRTSELARHKAYLEMRK